MIINRERKIIFVHVPRTGGWSANKFLKENNVGSKTASKMPIHSRLKDVEQWESYWSFGFLRNPWDRLFSCYRKQKEAWERTHDPKLSHLEKSFKEVLLNSTKYRFFRPGMIYLDGVSKIYKFEDFNESWGDIKNKLGLHGTVPHVNSVNYDDYRRHYDNEMIEWVAKIHRQDIRYFNYTFE